jgi:hypothetical protein
MLSKLRSGLRGKARCFGVFLLLLPALFNAQGRAVPDAGDPLGFFTVVADKMLRSTFPFGVTNIPVCSNGVYVYTPAVQRLLQLSANILDAANTNFYPSVFRPLFGQDAASNTFIIGYLQVTNVSGLGDPQLSPPYDAAQLSNFPGSNPPIADARGPVNVYGVPWIIGVKKGLPNFNQLSLVTAVPVTRKLQVTRTTTDPATATYATNQMYVMSISNNLGISFWNSYTTNYPRPLTVFASDAVYLSLSNGASSLNGCTNFYYNNTINSWPGAHWTGVPPTAQPQMASFLNLNWTFNFLNSSVYRFNTGLFDPVGSPTSGTFETTFPPLPPLPQFGLNTTNYLQAFILDGNNVIDYVQLRGPIGGGNLNQALADPNYIGPPQAHLQWSTNYPTSTPPTWGVANQLIVSGDPIQAPTSQGGTPWTTAPTVMGETTPPAEAAFFNGFFLPSFYYVLSNGRGAIYVNTLLAMQAPYTPMRTVYLSFLLQANDPLVHYLASDLNAQTGAWAYWAGKIKRQNGDYYRSDDLQNQPLPTAPASLAFGRYQPWLQPGQMDGLANLIPVTNNYACKDPLIEFSDNWCFPTNLLQSLVGLGQVHRGTPWQTFYLKDVDFTKDYTLSAGYANYVGTNTWMQWTGDFDANDAMHMAPVNDWRLAGLLMSLLNSNNPAQLFSVNDPNLADWQNILNGLTVYSNSAPMVFPGTPPTFDTYVLASNSPQALVIATALAQARAARGGAGYNSIGDILATPVLSKNSPFLNLGSTAFGQQQMNYGIADWEYEAIPAQLLPLLRPDSIGTLTPTNGGWSLWFSGADGYDYALQTSADLVNWNNVSTNSPVQGGFTVPIAPAAGASNQFFRAVLLP